MKDQLESFNCVRWFLGDVPEAAIISVPEWLIKSFKAGSVS